MTLDWLIVGGGIHGVHIAARLMGEAGVDSERLRIIDPGARLLERWRTCTGTTGMTHLRSPSVHNLDLNPWSLMEYAEQRNPRETDLFTPPYNRPNLRFFNDHCDRVIAAFDMDRLHLRDRAVACRVGRDGIAVDLASGPTLQAANVVLAIGAGEQPQWPAWAPRDHARVHHVFDPRFDAWPTEPEAIAVVGGGISAVQVALRLAGEGHDVHLVSRHALREHQFDSDPGWLGPRFMAGFEREADADRRRAMIAKARHRGSVPPDVRDALQAAVANRSVRWHEGQVDGVDARDAVVTMALSNGTKLEIQRVLMATGFAGRRPGGAFIDGLVKSASLPCAGCGYPIVDTALRWHPRVYVSGPLAELELGPSARNISGARRAADRLVAAAISAGTPAADGAPPIRRPRAERGSDRVRMPS